MIQPQMTVEDVKKLSDLKFKVCIGLIALMGIFGALGWHSINSYTHGQTTYLNNRRVVSDAHNAQTAAALASLQAKFDRLDNGICGLIGTAKKPLPPQILNFKTQNCP